MRFCQPHWTELREAIEARGLGHLVAANGRDAAARMVADLKGESDVSEFDPLMAAHDMILERAISVFGLAIMGEYCPLCELLKVTPPPPPGFRYATNEAYFIDGPADAMETLCRELGIAKAAASDGEASDERA